ncbi:hypothetical protein DFH05DRAFT_1495388 [Lentinula detonsa]|uniref:ABM domain-containing protein n=1 Tax=Lentinula detonsa TaxID=2804962 RepID=A0A9W8TXW0_9AGAR|nr:hypothetical protein DFH05DRAFT_1495388 [Lentinula detonsa]
MPITEFATLEVLGLSTDNSPSITQPPLIDHLRLVAEKQSAVSGYPVLFFESLSPTSKSTFYLVSGWRSVEAHYEWIQSQTNQELLVLLKDFIGVKGLAHIDVDFDEMRREMGVDFEAKLERTDEKSKDFETISAREGILAVSLSKNGRPPEQTNKSLKCVWTKEGMCLDQNEDFSKTNYRFEWFALSNYEDFDDIFVGCDLLDRKESLETSFMRRVGRI